MAGFIVGFILGLITGLFYVAQADNNAEVIYARLKSGEAACESHGGLAAWDFMGNHTCKNGAVITNLDR